jgi:hypothetical protein
MPLAKVVAKAVKYHRKFPWSALTGISLKGLVLGSINLFPRISGVSYIELVRFH